MKAFLASIKKELFVLLRDRGGMAILFIMPLVLVIIMALIQDGPYRNFQKSEFPLIYVDNDKDTVGSVIEKNLGDAKLFKISKETGGTPATEASARDAVSRGKFKVGVVVPAGLSDYLRRNAKIIVENTLSEKRDSGNIAVAPPADSLKIKYFLDPLTSFTFKSSVLYILQNTSASLVSQTVTADYFIALKKYFPIENKIDPDSVSIIGIEEISASSIYNSDVVFNSVQHNVPAWTMFAIFFIFLPLAGGIIKERDYGTFLRLRFMPHGFYTIITGKVILYTIVGCIQSVLMLCTGKYLLPLMGLPSLVIGNSIFSIMLIVFSASLAATAFGVLIGTFFSTHQQVVTFGAISVIILAAIGGIWVPIYIMSKTMAHVSKYSPLEWGLNAFNEVFLHHGGLYSVSLDVLKLLLFAFASFLLSFLYYRYKRIS